LLTGAFACSASAADAAPSAAPSGAGNARPNIIYILADDMGIGDVSAFNPKAIWKTPALDRLAQQGMIFNNAHAASAVCTPSRYALLTGRFAWRGTLKQGTTNGYSPALIEPGRLTLPEFLRDQGYATAMFGKWHLGLNFVKNGPKGHDIDYTKPFGGGPVANGFDKFYGISASLDMPPYMWLENDRVVQPPTDKIGDSKAPKLWRGGPIAPDFKMQNELPTLIDKTIAYLGERAAAKDGRPFFLYLALTGPHTPTLPSKEFEGKTPALYGDFVLNIDHDIGRIMAELDRLGLANDTMIVFTSDNGYAPAGNIPHLQDFGHDSSAGFRGTKSDAFEGGHREPFIVRWPGVTPAGSHCDALVGLPDFFATCAEQLGVALPGNAAEDSISMLALLKGAPASKNAREILVHHSGEGEFAIRQGRWKLILWAGSGGWSHPTKKPSPWTYSKPDDFTGLPPYQLYDIEADPAETTNLADKHPEIVQRLGSLMKSYIEKGRSTPGPDQPVVGTEKWPQLRWMKDFK
jgi:arylsulfatase A-like enzyme